jgi:hypothetical protein
VRRLLASLGLVALVLVGARPGASTDSAPIEETRVTGVLPGLEGRWLLLTTLGTGGHRSAASLWELTSADGRIVLHEHLADLPEPQRAALDRGGWDPTPADLEAIASRWDTLVPVPRGIVRSSHELIGPDAFDDAVKREPMAAGALWIARQTYGFAPGGSRPAQEIRVFAATSRDDRGWAGRYATAAIALAPMPLPIKLDGTFRLLRLPAPSRSLWQRVADAFRGCN